MEKIMRVVNLYLCNATVLGIIFIHLTSVGILDSGLPDVPDLMIAVALNRREADDWSGSALAGLQMRRRTESFCLGRVR
jgi:uncharacterized membrane protein YbaN (DUF454 family)